MPFNTSRYESLWLDDPSKQSNTAKITKALCSDKFHSKVFTLMQQFDNQTLFSNDVSSAVDSPPRKSISHPLSFTHVSHLDTDSNFGLEKTFSNLPPHKSIQNYLPIRRNSSDIEESYFELDNKVKAVATYRTTPSKARHTSVGTITNQESSQFSASSTFTANRMSCSSENSTITNTSKHSNDHSYKMKVLPCIPQDSIIDSQSLSFYNTYDNDSLYEEGEDYIDDGKFREIPSAPPPPVSSVTPEDRLKSFINRHELIEIASEDEEFEIGEVISVKKFKLSSDIEAITNKFNLTDKEALTNIQYTKTRRMLFQQQDVEEDVSAEDEIDILLQEYASNGNASICRDSLYIDTNFNLSAESVDETSSIADFFADLNLTLDDLSLLDSECLV